MAIKHAVMVGMMGKIADRFHEYHGPRNLVERLEMAQQVSGMDGIEIVYPSEFANMRETVKILKDSGLKISAVNLNVKSEKRWQAGSFTNPNPELRQQAIQEMKVAMDLAAELGASMISCCPLIDGHNYNFEVDYLKQWQWLEQGIAQASKHRSDLRVSLEYKLNESRNYNVLSDMGRTLYLCERIGLPYVGVTMDVGHALIVKETPAEALGLAAIADKLFYVHFNDNAREWDWDMLPGSVNFWDLLEVIFYLKRINWNGWFSYDVAIRDGDIVEGMQSSIAIVKTAEKLVDKIGMAQLESFIREGVPARTYQKLFQSLL